MKSVWTINSRPVGKCNKKDKKNYNTTVKKRQHILSTVVYVTFGETCRSDEDLYITQLVKVNKKHVEFFFILIIE